jgi:hypothetical protein
MKVRWEQGKVREAEIRAYCKQWGDVIFVREQIDGRWTSVSLTELPDDLREKWIQSFIEGNLIPYREIK